MRATTVIFSTGWSLRSVADLAAQAPEFTLSSLHYHFIEARRRTPDRADDFCAWLASFQPPPTALIDALRRVDFYFSSLPELRGRLIEVLQGQAPHE